MSIVGGVRAIGDAPDLRSVAGIVREAWRRSNWLTALTLGHVALAALLAMGALVDDAQVLGISRWLKPMKFAASIAIYLGALAWYAPEFGSPRARRWPLALAGWTMVIEIVAIVMQGARGTTSHYNIATWFDARVFNAMGIAIAINTVAMAWCGFLAWRTYRLTPSPYRLGIVLGLAVALAGSAIGGMMIGNNAHTVGLADGGPGLPLLNWSTAGGDLRVSHFLGLHALQGLPVIGALVGRRAVIGAAIAWMALTVATLAQALAGRPVLATRTEEAARPTSAEVTVDLRNLPTSVGTIVARTLLLRPTNEG